MTTPPPTPPTGPDDSRDPQVAGWLAVEPLDDVTRARLVRTALAGADDATATDPAPTAPEATPRTPAARRRTPYATLVSVAAAVLVALVVVGAVLRPGGHDDTTPSAKQAPASATATAPDSSRAADGAAAAPESSALSDLAETPLVLASIGDLGDVSSQAKLERAARAALATGTGPGGAPTTVVGCAVTSAAALGTPVATGTGRIDGRRATVVVVEQAAGTTAVVAVQGRTCARSVSVTLS